MERSDFEKRLSSLIIPGGTPVSEIEKQVFPIREAIAEMMPKSLFRYRACNERHIDAFENDKIFAVPADWFNDPYDTLVRYDYDGIKKYVDCVASADMLKQFVESEGKSCSFDPELITPEYVYRMWGGAVANEDIATAMEDVRRMK